MDKKVVLPDQTKLESAVESTANIGSGFFISLAVWEFVIRPLYDVGLLRSSIAITSIFTVTSWLRSYVWRRLFAVDWHKRVAAQVRALLDRYNTYSRRRP